MIPENIISKYVGKVSVIALFALMLTGCGGSSGDSGRSGSSSTSSAKIPLALAGVVTDGEPVSGATVNVLCTNTGPASTAPVSGTTKTGSDGSYTLTFGMNAKPPCLISASGGKTRYGSNKATFNSAAVAAGRVNITPLTSLIMEVLTQSANNTKTIAAGTSKTAMLKTISPAAITAAIRLVSSNVVALSNLSDPITTSFSATTPNPQNNALQALQSALENTHVIPSQLAQMIVSPTLVSPDTVTRVNIAVTNGCAALLTSGGCASVAARTKTGLIPDKSDPFAQNSSEK